MMTEAHRGHPYPSRSPRKTYYRSSDLFPPTVWRVSFPRMWLCIAMSIHLLLRVRVIMFVMKFIYVREVSRTFFFVHEESNKRIDDNWIEPNSDDPPLLDHSRRLIHKTTPHVHEVSDLARASKNQPSNKLKQASKATMLTLQSNLKKLYIVTSKSRHPRLSKNF